MSRGELLILQKMLTELLDKDFIYISNFPANALILFVKKLNKELQFYINYHVLNKLIKKNQYPISLINKTLK